jgi:hypothetical protein
MIVEKSSAYLKNSLVENIHRILWMNLVFNHSQLYSSHGCCNKNPLF